MKSLSNLRSRILSDAKWSAKSAELDAFWESVKGDTATHLPLLRDALAATGHPPFFYFDGSQLLLSHSDTPEDRRVALSAYPRCDLQDVEHTSYLYAIFRLAQAGLDTTDASFACFGPS